MPGQVRRRKPLSDRECEVLVLIALGYTNPMIAVLPRELGPGAEWLDMHLDKRELLTAPRRARSLCSLAVGLTSLVLAVTLGFGCGGPESEVGAPEAGDRNAALPTATATTLGAAEYPGVLAEIGVALSDIPEAQWPLLADGEVTFADYERAMLAHIACLAEHGIEVDGAAELDPSGTRLVFSPVHAGSDPGAARQSLEATMACWEEHAGVVAQVWAWVTEPTVDELQQAMKALVTCLEDSGAALPEDPAAQDTMLYQFEYRPCFEQVQAEFRIAGFVGYGP